MTHLRGGGGSLAVYPYKELTYNGITSGGQFNFNKPIKIFKENTHIGNEYKYAYGDDDDHTHVTFLLVNGGTNILLTYCKQSENPPKQTTVSLGLKGAAYMVNASPAHQDRSFTARAAPSEKDFIEVMKQLVRGLGGKTTC